MRRSGEDEMGRFDVDSRNVCQRRQLSFGLRADNTLA
jgi:hypothetical protein